MDSQEAELELKNPKLKLNLIFNHHNASDKNASGTKYRLASNIIITRLDVT